jgi:NAD(P)H-quinone oxidoreductase subunit I
VKTKFAAFLPEIIRSLFKRPATVRYPFEKLQVPKDFRGTPVFDSAKCIGCMICIRDCPAEAIEIIRVEDVIDPANPDKPKKKFKMLLHNDRCIHCAQCVESCPTDTYVMNADYEIAVFNRHRLKIEYK